MNVLVLNAGSSSLKFQVIATDPDRMAQNADERLCRGQAERIGGEAIVTVCVRDAETRKFTAPLRDLPAAVEHLLRWIASEESGIPEITSLGDIDAVGHRVVHGGELFSQSAVITDEVLRGIEQCIDLAPLHNPANLAGIRAARKVFGPDVPQIAVFDTAFHQTMPEQAYLYALPYHLYRRHHIRRFGFHGTSHRFVMERYCALHALAAEDANVITLHLGNGCSAAAIRGGQTLDTSMGMTPLEGLVMGTRSGDLDPAVVNVIATKEGLTPHEVESMLNSQSGLLGLSGLTNDMRALLAEMEENEDRRARLAIDIFCYRAKKYIGAYLAAMGGADAVIFTGGIGENAPAIRAHICDGLAWAGLRLDAQRNLHTVGIEGEISSHASTLRAFVIPTDEELMIARDTANCVAGERKPSLFEARAVAT